jgi:hypothetical protein
MFFRRNKPPERRQCQRFDGGSLPINCLPVGNDAAEQPWPAHVHDVSASGISLFIQRRFEVGVLLSLEILQPESERGQRFVARVVRVRQMPDSAWNLGCSFEKQLDEHSVRLFMAKPTEADDASQRAWYRFPSPCRTTCYMLGEREETVLDRVRVVNVSPAGIGLLVDREVELGTVLGIHVPRGKGYRHRVLARVVHCHRQSRSKVLLGCSFLGELSDQEFQAFLV